MKTRYVHYRSDKIFYRRPVEHGYAFSVAHIPAAVFFAHRIPWKKTVWTCSEEVSGARIGGEHDTRRQAIQAAKAKLATVDVQEFKRTQRRSLKYCGGPVALMPLYGG